MGRERNGSIRTTKDGTIYARVSYVDAGGKRREINRKAENRSEARRKIKQIIFELENTGEKSISGERMTFRHLAVKYSESKLFAAEYHDGRKVAGLRSWRDPKRFLETLMMHFGNKRIREITPDEIAQYKRNRLKQPKADKKQRTVASVNRELEVMRSALKFAEQQGWLIRSPFNRCSTPLISKADETKRERILSFDEERRLLAACGERTITYTRKGKEITAKLKTGREHLKAIIIAALDTAMRRGELFKLQWKDVDLINGLIHVRAINTKTQIGRTVGITPRLLTDLNRLYELALDKQTGLVFGILDTIKNGWKSLCKDAKIIELRFHDLRHTAITRMVNEGLPSAEVMKTSGHTQMTTFQRYVNPAAETVRRNAERLARYNTERMKELETKDLENELIN